MTIQNEFNLGDLVIVKEDFADSLPQHTRTDPAGDIIAWEVISVHYSYEGLSYGLSVGHARTKLFEDALQKLV